MTQETIEYLALDLIDTKPQVREAPGDDAIPVMAESLKENGQLQPIRVRPNADRYSLTAGERRLLAARMAGWKTIAAIVDRRDLSAADVVIQQLSENLARRALKPGECGRAVKKLMDLSGLTATDVAKRLGFSPATISRLLALDSLPQAIQAQVESGDIPASTAYEIAKVRDADKQAKLAEAAASGALKRDDVKAAAKKRGNTSGKAKRRVLPRASAKLSGGRSVTFSGLDVTLENVIAWLDELLGKARLAQSQGAELDTFLKALKDQAAA